MSETLTNFILSCRELVGDGPTDNLSRTENLDNSDIGNKINGTNTIFNVVNFPVAPGGTMVVVADGNVLNNTQYAMNEPLGLLTLTAAPANTLYVTYYYYLMSDNAWTEFVVLGLQRMNMSTGIPATDVPNLVEPLAAAGKSFAMGQYCARLATQTGLWYNQKLQERDEQRENISKKFLAMSKQYIDDGNAQLKAYYEGNGSQGRASFRIAQMPPRPWTPSR